VFGGRFVEIEVFFEGGVVEKLMMV